MTAFGIELRRVRSRDAIFAQVDDVLSRTSITDMQCATVAHSLQKMLSPSGYCDICSIRKCVEIMGTPIPKEHLDMYSALHCVSWSDMEEDYRTRLIAMILNDFKPALSR